jgi:hypothetical protein
VIAAWGPAALAVAAVVALILSVRHLTADDRHYARTSKGRR